MPSWADAASLLDATLGDRAAALLAESGLGDTWEQALRGVPPTALAASRGEGAGLRLLTALRDHWSAARALRPAIAATRALLHLRVAAGGRDHPDALLELGALGALAQRGGRTEEGLALLEQAWAGLRALEGPDLRVAVVAANLALHHVHVESWREAEGLLELAWRTRTRLAPETTGPLAAQLAEVKVQLGKLGDAVPLAREAWVKHQERLGPDHPATLARARTFGALLLKVDRPRLALEPLRAAHRGFKAAGRAEEAAAIGHDLGLALHQLGEREEGWRLMEEVVRWTRAQGDPARPHPALPGRLAAYASLQLARGRGAVAESLLEEAWETERVLHGDDSLEAAIRCAALGQHLASVGREAEAVGWLDPAASLLRSAVGDADPRTRLVVQRLVELLLIQAETALQRRDPEVARGVLARAWEVGQPALGYADRRVLKVRELADRAGLDL